MATSTMNNSEIEIAGRPIGSSHPPYVIAELSANHNGRLDAALAIIAEAKRCGADAVKLQTYTPDTLTIKCDKPDFKIPDGLWAGRTLYDLYQEAHTPWDWHAQLFACARENGITMFSSPFDATAVDLLEDLDAPAYKIASFEAIDLPLIEYAAATRKPLIISTGMANEEEINEAVDAARGAGCTSLAVLHCVSAYPAPPEDYNLNTIPDMISRLGCVVGLSDHTLDNSTAIAAVTLGASIVEKHFTLDRDGGGPDDSFSLLPAELAQLCTGVRTAWSSLGSKNYARKASEEDNLVFRRSLYFVEGLEKGEVITAENMRSIRPGFGLAPKFYKSLLGRTVNSDIERGTPVTVDLLDDPALPGS
jgi:pseudaminic acid synthase